jgi:hypothetical protein
MADFADPLVSSGRADRLHYATGELLGADDFRDEQTYHRRQLARALLYLHGSGSIAGLRVLHRHIPSARGNPDEVELHVLPGLAADRAGRLIEVPRVACLRLRRWFNFIADPERTATELNAGNLRTAWRADATVGVGGAVVADVFLAFHPCPRGYTPAFASGPFDALDASQPSRVRDSYELSLVLRTEPDAGLPSAFDPWSRISGGDLDERLASALQESLDMWTRATAPPPENPPGVDPAAVLLARLRIPAAPAATGDSAPQPDWTAGTWTGSETRVNNAVRHLVLPAAAVRRLLS